MAKPLVNELGAPLAPANELGDPLPVQEQAPIAKLPTSGEQQIANDQQALQKVRFSQANPWGTENNHPGKVGKIAHILSVAGNLAGNIVSPGVMANIPGSQLNMQMQEGGLAHRLNSEISAESQNQERDALTGKTQEETAEMPGKASSQESLQGAQGEHLNAETYAIEHPKPAVEIHDTPMGLMAIDKLNGTATPVTAHGQPIGPKLETSVVSGIIGQDGRPHSFIVDKSGAKVADLGEHYERPVTVNVGQERGAKNDILKAYQPTLDAAQRMNIMTENAEKAIKDHDQQAMLSLLANHIGMTLGAQKGARITKDILHEAEQSTPWLQGMRAKFDGDGVLSGVVLTPSQMKQMVGLGQSMYAESAKKSRATAQYLGAQDDGPARVPSPSTINFYTHLASGDSKKAKQMAEHDGWSVQ